ncbi:hypothetical protein ACFE04_014668 [Oxalis oulophora]
MSTYLQIHWPEPVVRVQSLAESGIKSIPNRYIKPPSHRPTTMIIDDGSDNIPLIDMQHVDSTNLISAACRDWGFFQVVNHGIDHELLKGTREVWREFFSLPVEDKLEYANTPDTYEGYGSRVGLEKGSLLDWSDYFFLHFLPHSIKKESKWPAQPRACRELSAKYGEEVITFCETLMKVMSINLGLKEDHLQNAFGGEKVGACLRANYYPKCPQPHLTLGLSPHSDPGGITILFPDDNVAGLQVRRDNNWVTIKPVPNAIIVNLGDQMQVLSNAIYKSVEHRVIANSVEDRLSLALFYNPRSDILIEPLKELVTEDRSALYQPMTFDEYRLYIRTKGACGKTQLESLKAIK